MAAHCIKFLSKLKLAWAMEGLVGYGFDQKSILQTQLKLKLKPFKVKIRFKVYFKKALALSLLKHLVLKFYSKFLVVLKL